MSDKEEQEEDSLEDKVKKLKTSLDEIAEPDADYQNIAEHASKAAAKTLEKMPGGKAVDEKDTDDEFNKLSQTYLENLGIKSEHNPEFYGSIMNRYLAVFGQKGVDEVKKDITRGNYLKALNSMQTAYQINLHQERVTNWQEKLKKAEPEVRDEIAEDMAEYIAGDQGDKYRVLTNLEDAYKAVQDKKETAKQFHAGDSKAPIYKISDYKAKKNVKKAA